MLLRAFGLGFFVLFTILPAQSQSLYDWDNLNEIRITFDDKDWASQLDTFKANGKDRLMGTVEINDDTYENVGIRYKGNSSYYNVRKNGSNKLPFNLKIDYKNKSQELPSGHETLKLSNVFRDPSFVREVLSYEIARKYMPAPEANYAKLYINGEYMGLYNNTESIDDRFLNEYFGETTGSFFKCDPEWKGKKYQSCPQGDKSSLQYLGDNSPCYFPYYEIKSDSGWTNLKELTNVLNNETERIEEILDVDMALWMLAFNTVLVNLDSYTGRLCHNYYLYQRENGQFVPLLWDMNLSFGGFRFAGTGKSLSDEEMQRLSILLHYKTKNEKRPLITNLLSKPLYRKIYLGHVRTIAEENFKNGWYKERMQEIADFIEPEVEADENKLYPSAGLRNNQTETVYAGKAPIIGIEQLMEPRIEYLLNHSTLKDGGPQITKVEHLQFGNTLAFNATIESAERAYLVYRLDPKDQFTRMEMFDDSGHNDQMAGDNIWGATLDYQVGIEYYILAEGERSANVSPARASYEFYTVEQE